MKLFGFEFFKSNTVRDQTPEVAVVVPDTKQVTQIPRVIDPVLKYSTFKYIGRGAFNPAEYNLAEAQRIEDTESYVRQAFGKKVALMFKEGWDFVGSNPRTVKYIRTRFAQIATASSLSTAQLFRSLGSGLIRKSNAFLLKVRNIDASGGSVRSDFATGKEIKPVAAYFVIPSETMEFSSENNRIVKWRQRMPDGLYQEYNTDDIVHIYYDRKEGFIFGTPTIVPVIDDIRALRKIEENIELLVYQHLFPLFQYRVGTETAPAGLAEDGRREVDVVRQEIQNMPSEGGIVTTERHEVRALGAEGRALRAEGYLDHFKKRVISGLGISAVDLGEGETSNRSTADTMSRNLVDSVKDFQLVLEEFINELIVKELLLESTFGPMVLEEENRVTIKFKEIDLDYQIKKEAHYADQFNKDVITHDEARLKIGYEPIPVPTSEEAQGDEDLSVKYPAWYKTRWKLFEEPKTLIQSIDEPYSAEAKSAAKNRSLEVGQAELDEETEEQKTQTQEENKLKLQIAKQKKTPARDAFLEQTFSSLKEDILSSFDKSTAGSTDWAVQLVRIGLGTTVDRMISSQVLSFRNGYVGAGGNNLAAVMPVVRNLLSGRSEKYINKLINDVAGSLHRNIKSTDTTDISKSKIRAIFDSMSFRTKFIEDVEPKKAFNYGKLIAFRDNDVSTVRFSSQITDCNECMSVINKDYSVSSLTLDDVPPFHASCSCSMELSPYVSDASNLEDRRLQDPSSPEGYEKGEFTTCPECGKTALRKKDTPDIYNCRACGHSFRSVTDATKLERCVLSVKNDLRGRHPNWSEDRIKSVAFAICNSRIKDD